MTAAVLRSRRSREIAVDGGLALGVAVLAEIQVWTVEGLEGSRAAIAALSAALALSLLLRRRHPLAVVVAVCLYFVVTSLAGWNTPDVTFFPSAALMLASYSVAAHGDTRTALIGAGLVVGIGAGALVAGDLNLVGVFFLLLFNAASWSAGQLVHTRDEQAQTMSARSAVLERETEERTRVAVAEERARIARELHDVVSHGLSGMMLEAAGAEHVLRDDPDAARDSLRSIQSAGAEATGELRRLLGMMRGAPSSDGDTLPTLAHAGELVDRARRSGMDVELTSAGDLETLPAGIQVAAYRIVQEALTNVVKHAPGAAARVDLRREPGWMEVEVANAGGRAAPARGKPGHGLVGMRERVAVYGGALEAGPLREGGFRVNARFPLSGASAGEESS